MGTLGHLRRERRVRRRPAGAVMAERAAGLLRVDADRTIAALVERVRAVKTASGADTALMGLSGGLDSAVLAEVAVRALGAGWLRLAYLYDHLITLPTHRGLDQRRAVALAGLVERVLDKVE